MRESTLERNKFGTLQPKALAYDIDPAGDYMKPGNSPAEQAFQLLHLGFDMLLHLADNAFPSFDKRTRKKGPKWVRQASLFFAGDASTLLAHAIPALYAKVEGRLSGDEPPELTGEHHRKLYETVRSFYPLGRGGGKTMEQWLTEYRTMEEHLPREAVTEGRHPANPYSEALLRGENPDDDPELVALQRDYARDYFIDRAIHGSITKALNPNDRRLLEKKLVRFTMQTDPTAAELMAHATHEWIVGTKPYLEYASLDVQ